MKIEIKSINGTVLFMHDCEDNTIQKTLLLALSSRADLSWANLSGADLSRADLSGANLSWADLSGANLSGADLSGADLSGADLSGADLSGADLSRADLSGADLSRADLSRAEKMPMLSIAQTRILPEGDIIGYKKAHVKNGCVIVKLLIPKEAKRSNAFGRKCRAEYATVLEISDGVTEAFSSHNRSFLYHVGDTVRPTEQFNEDFTQECSSGIHFFITELEAKNLI